MKTRALLIAAMLAPVAYAQLPSARKPLEPPLADEYNSSNARPEKVAGFKARAAELNKRRAALEEEGKKIDKNANAASLDDYYRRVEAWRVEVQAFRKEISEEFRLKRNQTPATAKLAEARQKAMDAAVAPLAPAPAPAAPGAAVTPAAPAKPVAEPKPSSVPGFPAGVEPAKKATKDLPPGMSKR